MNRESKKHNHEPRRREGYQEKCVALMVFAVLLILLPSSVIAGEGVRVTLSVKEIQFYDLITSHLSTNTQWAFSATDVQTGAHEVTVGTRPREKSFLIPGSLLKLLVTAAIIDKTENKAIDLNTYIMTSGEIDKGTLKGDLLLKGSGNPFLSTQDLFVGIEKIKAFGIKEIEGDIVIDDSLFDVNGWASRYNGPAYGVPSALGLDLHTVSITGEGSKNKYVIDPTNDAVKVSFNPSGKPGIRQIDDLTYEITGAVPDAPVVRSRFSLKEPSSYAGGAFLTLLKKSGIKVTGSLKRKNDPSTPASGAGQPSKRNIEDSQLTEIAKIGAPDISAYVSDTNKQSLNVAADNLVFHLGALAYGSPGTRKKGIQAIHDFLHDLRVPIEGIVLEDGSGVSERNRISSEQMVILLRAIAKKQWFSTFFESLSIPGRDGRLRDFGYRSDRIHAKSGQVTDAYSLAGYVDQLDGRRVAFSFIVNGPDLDTAAAKSAAIEVLQHLEDK